MRGVDALTLATFDAPAPAVCVDVCIAQLLLSSRHGVGGNSVRLARCSLPEEHVSYPRPAYLYACGWTPVGTERSPGPLPPTLSPSGS